MARSKTFADGEILTPADVNDHLVNHVPNPGDVYDTGWLTLSSGTINVWARRVGLVVTVSADMSAVTGLATDLIYINGGAEILPVDMRPPRPVHGSAMADEPNVTFHVAALLVQPNGSMALIKPKSATTGLSGTATYVVG